MTRCVTLLLQQSDATLPFCPFYSSVMLAARSGHLRVSEIYGFDVWRLLSPWLYSHMTARCLIHFIYIYIFLQANR